MPATVIKYYHRVPLDAKVILSLCHTTWVKVYQQPNNFDLPYSPPLPHHPLIHYKVY